MILAAFAAYVARSLERLKSSLSWNGELLRKRLDFSLNAKHQMQAIEDAYVQVVGGKLIPGTGGDPTILTQRLRELEDTSLALSILQADETTITAMEDFGRQALQAIDVKFDGVGQIVVSDDGHPTIKSPSPEAAREMHKKIDSLRVKREMLVVMLRDAFGGLSKQSGFRGHRVVSNEAPTAFQLSDPAPGIPGT